MLASAQRAASEGTTGGGAAGADARAEATGALATEDADSDGDGASDGEPAGGGSGDGAALGDGFAAPAQLAAAASSRGARRRDRRTAEPRRAERIARASHGSSEVPTVGDGRATRRSVGDGVARPGARHARERARGRRPTPREPCAPPRRTRRPSSCIDETLREVVMLRNASFAWYSVLALSFASMGCPKKEEADKDKSDEATKDKSKGKKAKKADDEDKKADDDDAKGKKTKKADDDDDDAKGKKAKKGDDDDKKAGDDKGSADTGAPLSVELEGKKYEFKYGHAKPGNDNIDITLSTEKLPCDKWKVGDDGFTLEFHIGPGTDGKFFADQKVGAQVYWNSPVRKFKRSFAYAYETGLTMSPFKLESGEKLKGTLEFDALYSDFSDPTKKQASDLLTRPMAARGKSHLSRAPTTPNV
jgi:hypothetical protein